jgi:formylglycine-generating enzyme required for sulfatase activity
MTFQTAELPLVRNPNDLSDRAAMGLPGSYVERIPHDVWASRPDLFQADPQSLADICQDATEPFDSRYAAGSLLALRGDPRIVPEDPQMIDIPAGIIEIGLPGERVSAVVDRWERVGVLDSWIRKECPRHQVSVGAFRIASYPVTNVEYQAFLRDSGSDALPTSWKFGCYPVHLANHPVWTVRPEHADAYAAWLAARTNRAFRLPAEAEWEYAASGGTDREYPWGNEFDSANANTVESGPLTTTPVGIYPSGRSAFGADDMAGNVEEITASVYRAYPGGVDVNDHLRQAAGAYRVTRGGSFTRFGDLARCTRRHGPYSRDFYAIGFRIAESV